MPHTSQRHRRRSIRLRGYDYTRPGAYFATIVTHGRECLFGDIADGEMRLNSFGEIARDEWARSEVVRPEIQLDAFTVMPNHIHAIVWIRDTVGAQGLTPLRDAPLPRRVPYRQPRSLGALIGGFKSSVTKRINEMRHTPGTPVWQRNYWERIIRDDDELDRIREYIAENPSRWAEDQENPDARRQQ